MVTMFDSDLQMILDQTTKKNVISPRRKLFLACNPKSWILKFARLRARKESHRDFDDGNSFVCRVLWPLSSFLKCTFSGTILKDIGGFVGMGRCAFCEMLQNPRLDFALWFTQ